MRYLWILLLPLSTSCQQGSRPIARLVVEAVGEDRWNTPVKVAMDARWETSGTEEVHLVELKEDGQATVPCQVINGSDGDVLAWVVPGVTPAGESRTFELWSGPADDMIGAGGVRIAEGDKTLDVYCADQLVLSYWFQEKAPPPGVDEHYHRSAFIHPINTPAGATLTRIQPPDHYHHYGLWNPWTHVLFSGDTIDFWNLAQEEGTVRSKRVEYYYGGRVSGGFAALHGHIVLPGEGQPSEVTALEESWEVAVWPLGPNGRDGWIIDFVSTMECATESPFTILKYRYQGFGFRARTGWDDESCELLTSEGKNKENGNATRARWCSIHGPTEAGTSGILFMTHPSNHDYPERLRIWPHGANKGKDNVFFNFNPAQDKDWTLEPGRSYQLKYRMYVYDGTIDEEKAEMLWNDFARSPSIEKFDQ